MTLGQVAELLKTPEATLRWWRHTGQGPSSFRAGRRVLYLRSVVERWIEHQAACDRTASTPSSK
ncbi:helix-turn-helix transcriptional regulator [Terrabacter sp. 2RAF25]|uniref:helix-turn-helix transcriptional regulator n=1 Tax=Terrabacter sp. 2RAF25 TaxID=3232998 RepID=UPI003F9BDB3E